MRRPRPNRRTRPFLAPLLLGLGALLSLAILLVLIRSPHDSDSKPEPRQEATQEEQAPDKPSMPQGWPEWSGPVALGPGKDLASPWCLEYASVAKPGEPATLLLTSSGEWSDATMRKGGAKGHGALAPEELEAVRQALCRIDWDKLPAMKDKTYTAYHALPKEYLGPLKFTGHTLTLWTDRTDAMPWYDGRKIMLDGKAPAAPEAEELVKVLQPILDRCIPPAAS